MAALYRRGSRGPYVKDIQNALNEKLKPSPNLVPDGIFGPLTDAAVRAFQKREHLSVDGIVGPNTISALMVSLPPYPPVMHNIQLIPQPTNNTCWAASLAMVKRTTVDKIIEKTPKDMILPSGGVKNFSGSPDNVSGNQRFANVHGLKYYPPQSHTVAGFRELVQYSPLILSMLWKEASYASGKGSNGHRVVISGINGDGDQTGKGTYLRIHDPWAPNVGKISTRTYFDMATSTPCFTYGVFSLY